MKMPEEAEQEEQPEMEACMSYLNRRKPRKFLMDFSYMDMVWSEDTKLIIRAGDYPPVVIDSPSRLVSMGQFEKGGFRSCDTCELKADRGYLLWTNPRGSIEVRFKYGTQGDDFNCYIDPQHQGVRIYENRGYKKTQIIDGKKPISASVDPHHIKSPVRPGENNFEFRSMSGEVRLEFEVIRDADFPKPKAFKFNYVLAL
ncbi:uncharacterized protein LOC100889549 [Strongylocentrotus purpuratus]|uniref:Uncharacterized protein n=1 Tax=Strongylocentrotus purpuratus TaxID=7668 RepID=A0A7M7LL01_STRPU|nr:uncharacterized protein LOC100889549 [Strongylocentrotus purpuratus]|eukprot:XP_003723451.1 PREDICTED: uncharacterized protein LOC100889549 [Strongylocentrotus purpuratus]